jgi:cobalamin biosynthesis protein CbiG
MGDRVWVGIGCRRGTSAKAIAQAVQNSLAMVNLAEGAIAGVATLEQKTQEPGLLEFCQAQGLPLRGFSAQALARVVVPNPSKVVQGAVGCASVAEAAAILACGAASGGDRLGYLLLPKHIVRTAGEVVTIALAQLSLPKKDFTLKESVPIE